MQNLAHIVMVGCDAPCYDPSLAVIRELVNRQHRVSYVVGETLPDLVAPTGAELVGHPSLLPQGDVA